MQGTEVLRICSGPGSGIILLDVPGCCDSKRSMKNKAQGRISARTLCFFFALEMFEAIFGVWSARSMN